MFLSYLLKRSLLLIILLSLLLGLSSCAKRGGNASRSPQTPTPVQTALSSPSADSSTSTSSDSVPPAPQGTGCHTVTYTPQVPAPEQADLCLASSDPSGVAIILVHGGGSVQGTRSEMQAWQQFFQSNNITTLNIEYFLITKDTPAPVFPREERNLKAAAQYLRANARVLGINPERIVLLGTSAGARLGGIVATTPDDPSFAGPGHWPQVPDHLNGFIGFYGGYTGQLLSDVTGLTMQQYYGGDSTSTNPEVQQRIAKATAIRNAAQTNGPVLLFHGDADTKAPVKQSIQFNQALQNAGKDSTLIVVPGADHSFDRAKTAGRPLTPEGQQAASQILAWLHTHFS